MVTGSEYNRHTKVLQANLLPLVHHDYDATSDDDLSVEEVPVTIQRIPIKNDNVSAAQTSPLLRKSVPRSTFKRENSWDAYGEIAIDRAYEMSKG